MDNDIRKSDFDIFVLAGQSNAEGNGLGNDELIYQEDPRIYQIADKNKTDFETVDQKVRLKIVLPMEKVFSLEHERDTENGKAASFVDTFIRKYLECGYLKEGRKILVLRGAVGGTGFSRNEWGVNSVLYNRLISLIEYALNLGGNNKIVALLWHQGEHDASEQKWLNCEQRYKYYYEHLSTQMHDFQNRYGSEIPIIAGGFCDDDANTIKEASETVERATADFLKTVKYGGFASSDGLLSNDQVIANGDKVHFCRKSCKILGGRYFEIFKSFNIKKR